MTVLERSPSKPSRRTCVSADCRNGVWLAAESSARIPTGTTANAVREKQPQADITVEWRAVYAHSLSARRLLLISAPSSRVEASSCFVSDARSPDTSQQTQGAQVNSVMNV